MKKLLVLLLISLTFMTKPLAIAAEDFSLGVGNSVQIEGTDIPSGSVISYVGGKFTLTTTAYDRNLVGVVVDKPAAAFVDLNNPGRSIVTVGTGVIRVTTANGKISAGDW